MQIPKIGISIGDINGIGPEVIIKCFEDKRILEQVTPIIYGSSKVMSYHKNIVKPKEFSFHLIHSPEDARENQINLINCWNENANIELGKITEDGGKYAHVALDRLVQDIKKDLVDAMITAPIHKNAMQLVNFPYPGHTEFLSDQFGQETSLMLMVSDELRVGVLTNHIPLKEVPSQLSADLISVKIKLLDKTLRRDYYIDKPKIALLALNPHAGDGGLIGDEDTKVVLPTIEKLKDEGIMIFGPFPADGFFGSSNYRNYDGIMATYHDQGLIPFKLLSFGKGYNYTAGLPKIRTSVDHGTAFDLVGTNQAEPSSIRAALYGAIDIIRNRHNYDKAHENPLERRQRKDER